MIRPAEEIFEDVKRLFYEYGENCLGEHAGDMEAGYQQGIQMVQDAKFEEGFMAAVREFTPFDPARAWQDYVKRL